MFNKKIVIVCPRVYSGGTLVLATLCKLLREKSIDARLFYIDKEPQCNTNMFRFWLTNILDALRYIFYPILCKIISNPNNPHHKAYKAFLYEPVDGTKKQLFPFFNRKVAIVIYPEKVYGNFLCARNIVRWLLYYNPFPDDSSAYGENDFFMTYRQIFNDYKLNPEGYEVQLSWFDKKMYRQYNYGERKGNCYIVRKGRDRNDIPKELDGPIIDDFSEEEKVRIFNQCRYCYSYDLQTFYSTIASVCGCISVIVLEPGKKKEDYWSQEDLEYGFGVAYGNTPEEINYACKTREKLLKLLDFRESNEEAVMYFLNLLEKRFG